MEQKKPFQDFVNQCIENLPSAVQDLKKTVEQHSHQMIQNIFSRLNLVTRQEFEVQKAVLERTRSKIDALEQSLTTSDATNTTQSETNIQQQSHSTDTITPQNDDHCL